MIASYGKDLHRFDVPTGFGFLARMVGNSPFIRIPEIPKTTLYYIRDFGE
jgi:hypothetical protein